MEDVYAREIVGALKDLARHVANIDARLAKLVKNDGLTVEMGIHEKLEKIANQRT